MLGLYAIAIGFVLLWLGLWISPNRDDTLRMDKSFDTKVDLGLVAQAMTAVCAFGTGITTMVFGLGFSLYTLLFS
jgi:hypothetical protein